MVLLYLLPSPLIHHFFNPKNFIQIINYLADASIDLLGFFIRSKFLRNFSFQASIENLHPQIHSKKD